MQPPVSDRLFIRRHSWLFLPFVGRDNPSRVVGMLKVESCRLWVLWQCIQVLPVAASKVLLADFPPAELPYVLMGGPEASSNPTVSGLRGVQHLGCCGEHGFGLACCILALTSLFDQGCDP